MFDPEYQLGRDRGLLTSKDTIRFFDIDGVLSIYGYGTDGINVCSDDKFDAFIENFDLYKYAVAPDFMRDYINRYTDPEKNYVISQSGSPAQDKQKIAFVNRCYPGAFPEGHIIFSRTNEKEEAVRNVLETLPDGISTPHIVIDDSVGVLSLLQEAGISAVHVSSLLMLAELRDMPKPRTEDMNVSAAERTGEKLKEIRIARWLTREELGKLVGLDQNRVQQYENGKRKPKKELLNKFAEALNVSPLALTTPDTRTVAGAMHALFDMEELYGAELNVDREEGKAYIKFPSTSPLFKSIDEWCEKRVRKYFKQMRPAMSEEEIAETEQEYKDWKWRFE